MPGTYLYTYRFSLDGTHFTAADVNGAGSEPNQTFEPGSIGSVTVTPAPVILALDIDGNEVNDPLTDGVLVLRYLFGFRGEVLIAGAYDTEECTRCDADEIEAFFESLPTD